MAKFIAVTSPLLLPVFIAWDYLGSYPFALCSFNNNLQVQCLTSITSLPFNFNLPAHFKQHLAIEYPDNAKCTIMPEDLW